MKKISIVLLGIAFTAFAACTGKSSSDNKDKENTMQNQPPANNGAATATPEPATGTAAALKEHVCTDKCKDGNHMYAHGEKGHTCTDACKKEGAMKDGAMMEHKCTDKCKDGTHMYAHGEKGHTCTDACKKAAA